MAKRGDEVSQVAPPWWEVVDGSGPVCVGDAEGGEDATVGRSPEHGALFVGLGTEVVGSGLEPEEAVDPAVGVQGPLE